MVKSGEGSSYSKLSSWPDSTEAEKWRGCEHVHVFFLTMARSSGGPGGRRIGRDILLRG